MATTTSRNLSRLRFAADETSLERLGGAQIDWTRVTAVDADNRKVVPSGTVMSRVTASGLLVPRSATFALTNVSVSSNVATATSVAHGLTTGDSITVSGASLAYVNGVKTVTVTDANTITFPATGANASATGTIVGARVAVGILETDAHDQAPADSLSGYSLLGGGVVYDNVLPDATGTPKAVPAAYKAELATAGCTFKFVRYVDSRAI
jgi:hypothetical protein